MRFRLMTKSEAKWAKNAPFVAGGGYLRIPMGYDQRMLLETDTGASTADYDFILWDDGRFDAGPEVSIEVMEEIRDRYIAKADNLVGDSAAKHFMERAEAFHSAIQDVRDAGGEQ